MVMPPAQAPPVRKALVIIDDGYPSGERRFGGELALPGFDGSVSRPDKEYASELTFIMYLNDDFTGGATKFYSRKDLLQGAGAMPQLCVQPKRGMALVFFHRQLHEGAAVERGCKYVLRTDVMYGRHRENLPVGEQRPSGKPSLSPGP
jgi:2OG-Fe(II) oxygenase superfamily